MNKSIKITGVVALLGLVSIYGVLLGNSNSKQDPVEQYAVVTYYPYSQSPYVINRERYSVRILYGGNKVENIKLSKEELAHGMSNAATTILAKLSNEGYSLVSTTAAVRNSVSTDFDTEVLCFLKKVK